MPSACVKQPSIEQLMADAKHYEATGDKKSAIIQLRNVLKQNPENGEARYLLGSIYLENGNNLRAENQLREALKENYNPKVVLPLLAQALFAQGKFQAVLDETRSSDHGDIALQPRILSLRGHSQLSLGKNDEAAQSFNEALKRDPKSVEALLGEARLAIKRRDVPAALKYTDQAISSDAKNLNAWLMKGDLERSINKMDDAKTAYQKAFELNPKGISTNMNMASMAIAAGKFDDAKKYVDTMRKVSPDSPIGNYFFGLIEFREKHFKTADEAIQQVLKKVPSYMPAKALAGASAFYLGSYERAVQQLQDVVPLYPNSVYFRKLLAAAYLKTGKPQKSLDTLQQYHSTKINDNSLLALIAEAYYRTGDIAKAKHYFEAAAKSTPENQRVRAGLGLIRLASGETDRAIADLESAIQAGDTNVESYLISSLLSTKQYNLAYKVVTRLEKEKDKNNPNLQNIKGTILLAQKDPINARKAFERALVQKPGYFPAMMNLATLDLKEKHFDSARSRYKQILDKQPSNIEVMMALAKLELITGNKREGVTWLEHAKSLDPQAFAPNFTLAQIFIQEQDYSKAVAVLRDALTARPQQPEALNMLGFSQLKLGQTGNAVSTYTKLSSLYPNSAQALYGLGVAQAAAGEQKGAILTLQQVLDQQPDFQNAIATLVNLEITTGSPIDALNAAKGFQHLHPKRAFGHLMEGDIYMADKKYDQASQAYNKAFHLDNNPETLKRLHNAMRLNNKGKEADGLLVAWLKDHPDDWQIRLYYADAAIKEDRIPLAIEQYQVVLQKHPKNLEVMHNLQWSYQQQHNTPKALQIARKAYEVNPNAIIGLVDLANLLLERGEGSDGDRAVRLLEKARDLAPTKPEPRFYLAKAYVKTGDNDSARKELKHLVTSNEDFAGRADAERLLKQLSQ